MLFFFLQNTFFSQKLFNLNISWKKKCFSRVKFMSFQFIKNFLECLPVVFVQENYITIILGKSRANICQIYFYLLELKIHPRGAMKH